MMCENGAIIRIADQAGRDLMEYWARKNCRVVSVSGCSNDFHPSKIKHFDCNFIKLDLKQSQIEKPLIDIIRPGSAGARASL